MRRFNSDSFIKLSKQETKIVGESKSKTCGSVMCWNRNNGFIHCTYAVMTAAKKEMAIVFVLRHS